MVHWFHRTIFPGDQGADVATVQRILGMALTKEMDSETVARVRGLQRVHSLPITGVIDTPTALAVGESATYGLVPTWFQPSLIDETGLREALHIRVGVNLDDAVRRFQSARGHYPTGVVDERLAIEIGE